MGFGHMGFGPFDSPNPPSLYSPRVEAFACKGIAHPRLDS